VIEKHRDKVAEGFMEEKGRRKKKLMSSPLSEKTSLLDTVTSR
jgi:hypothetical protein